MAGAADIVRTGKRIGGARGAIGQDAPSFVVRPGIARFTFSLGIGISLGIALGPDQTIAGYNGMFAGTGGTGIFRAGEIIRGTRTAVFFIGPSLLARTDGAVLAVGLRVCVAVGITRSCDEAAVVVDVVGAIAGATLVVGAASSVGAARAALILTQPDAHLHS